MNLFIYVTTKITVIWKVTVCSLVDSTLKIETEVSSITPVNVSDFTGPHPRGQLFIYGAFNDIFSSSGYMTSNDRNNE
jgi:hypothetical protein